MIALNSKSVGQQLQERRQQYKLSLGEVAKKLRIKEVILYAIEEGRTEELPPLERLPLSFIKGFVRSYASFLKLDSNRLSREFEEKIIGCEEEEPTLEQEKEPKIVEREVEKPRFSFFFGQIRLPVAIASGVVLIGLLLAVESGWQTSETVTKRDHQEENNNNYTGEYKALDKESVENDSLTKGDTTKDSTEKNTEVLESVAVVESKKQVEASSPSEEPSSRVVQKENKTLATGKEQSKDQAKSLAGQQVERQKVEKTVVNQSSENSRIALVAKKSVNLVIYRKEKEYKKIQVAAGIVQYLPEGREYRMTFMQTPDEQTSATTKPWQKIKFMVDGMEIGFAIEAPQNVDSELVLDGYAMVSGNWEWKEVER